jgi:hypothetical protein
MTRPDEMLRISSEETGQARCARVPDGGSWKRMASIEVGVGVAEPRLGREVLLR